MKSIKKIFHIVLYSFLGFCVFVCLAAILVFIYLAFDDKGHCLSEEGGVWDDNQKICRQDCLTWNKKDGCIPITEENIKKKEQGKL